MAAIGAAVAALHDAGLVHGDLTTSNLMLRDGTPSTTATAATTSATATTASDGGVPGGGALVLIDFGLAYNSVLPEDKGVDLYVLVRALASAHASIEGLV